MVVLIQKPASIRARTQTAGQSGGCVHEDYFEWVNEFEAHHPSFGRVWGDFESEVFADSEAGYDAFVEHHAPNQWDYHDI